MTGRMETNQVKLMTEREANRKNRKADFKKMMDKWKADHKKRKGERKVDQEVATRLENNHKTDTNQMRVELEMKHN
jgi:hypothetical protein